MINERFLTAREGKAADDGGVCRLDDILRRLAAHHPSLIAKVAADYQKLAFAPVPIEAKDFAAHQRACRAALAHMEQLVKLCRWAEGFNHEAEASGYLELLIAEAAAAIKDQPEEDE